jgi:PhzF family phenazine biosynthesis protein
MKIKVRILNAFSIGTTGGNPAGVVLNADNLSTDQKQEIARKAGLSETAFVSSSQHADFKMEFFTPSRQIAHCGHATIATFTYLKKLGFILGDSSSKETIDGTRKIFFQKGEAFMEQVAPRIHEIEDTREVAESLQIGSNEIQAWTINTGNTFVIVRVSDQKSLMQLKPDFERVAKLSEHYNAIGYYVFTLNDLPEEIDATARMFAPAYGINEESATGMAAGPLACLLHTQQPNALAQYLIEQGRFMERPSPSLLKANLKIVDERIDSLYVGGDAFVKSETIVEIG